MTSSSRLVFLLFALGVLNFSQAQDCQNGSSDMCEDNPTPSKRYNPDNYQTETCNLKWAKCNVNGKQKPPAYYLCTKSHFPSGKLPTDGYTMAFQTNDYAPNSPPYTLHGLWSSNHKAKGATDQPYGCLNGEDFDELYLSTFSDLFNYFWPTDPQYNNTLECFVMSEWMKHGTCAVIPGADGSAFRIEQEQYYRTAFILTNEYNVNSQFHAKLGEPGNTPIDVKCVECAYFAASTWTGTSVASVPRMPASCIDQCYACDDSSPCQVANLDSTVEFDPSNAPHAPATLSSTSTFHGVTATGNLVPASAPTAEATAAVAGAHLNLVGQDVFPLEYGLWRSFGAEQLGSGKFEFTQSFLHGVYTSTTDSPYPNQCNYRSYVAPHSAEKDHVLLVNCGSNKHTEDCLVKRLPDIGGLQVAFLACNHSGIPAPLDFNAAMDTPNLGNFLMFRCMPSDGSSCDFTPIASTSTPAPAASVAAAPAVAKAAIHPYQPGVGGAPKALLGSWRTLEVSNNYQAGLVRWNFTSDGHATSEFPYYPDRGVQRYVVTHSTDGTKVYLANQSGSIKSCLFKFQYNSVYSYALLACGADNAPAPNDFVDGLRAPNHQWAMGRCNGCSGDCFYSCGPQNDNCGHGSCDPALHATKPAPKAKPVNPVAAAKWVPPNWCPIGDASCWPTRADIAALELQLGPNDPRTELQWSGLPQPQTAPVPPNSNGNFSFYGLGNTQKLKALYYFENLEDIHKPCFAAGSDYQSAPDICKASVRGNEYRNWNPFIVVFPLNERHIRAALEFAVKHRLCIATSGTGHEYNSRQTCPAGGIMIRTILLKSKTFLPTWEEDPSVSPHGAFRFGSGSIFAEMHNFSANHNRLVSSGWCSTVGMPGWHLGGGHGPFAPSLGLGVDNTLEMELLQIGYDKNGKTVIHKKTVSRKRHPQLFWALRGGGGGVWGVILSITTRAHLIPEGGLTNVQMTQTGNFGPKGYEWLRGMWDRFAKWNLMLNQKVSTQPGFFIDTSRYAKSKNLMDVTWSFSFEYFYAGGQNEPDYKLFRDKLKEVLEVKTATEITYKNAYLYVLSMPPNKFLLNVNNPLPAPHPPSNQATGSQNSVFVSREAMKNSFASTMMSVLDICVSTLQNPDPTSPDPAGYRCGFHYLYTSITGNLGSQQPEDTAIAPGFRSGLMLWNARTLTTKQTEDTIYRIGQNSYFSESPYVLPNWIHRNWGDAHYQQLLAVKQAHDPGNHFWCHHCVGDNPDDSDGAVYEIVTPPPKGNFIGHH